MKKIVVMPGGFHPFHAGHADLYQQAKKAFPGADIYVAATNDQSERPFPFALKEKLAKLAGVESGHFVQVKSPFQAKEITQHYNPEQDVLIFVRSEKDRNEPPKPGGTKKDGSPAYFQPYTGKDLQPFSQHAYMAYLKTVEFGPGITSASEIRNAWPKLNEKRKLAMVMSLYPTTKSNPKLAQNVVDMFDQVMGGQVDEGWKDVVVGGAMALGALGAGAQTMPDINVQQVELANKYYNVLVQRAKEDGIKLDTRTLNVIKAKAQDAAAKKTQQSTYQQGFSGQGSERKVAKDAGQFESQGVAENDLDRFKKYTRPVVKTTPKIEKTTNPAGRTTDHIEWKVTTPTGEIYRYKSKKQAQEHFDSFGQQGVAEGYSNTTFNVDRRKLNVPTLIQKGAILVTHPHGEQGWETDNKEDWAFSLLSLYNVLQGGWASEAKKYLKPESYKRAEQQINSSAPNLGSDKLVYDGKYNQILWSIKKLGIPDNVAFLDKDKQGVAEEVNPEVTRDSDEYFEPSQNVRMGNLVFNARTFTGALGEPNAKGLQIRAYDPKNLKSSIGSADFIVKKDKKGNQWLESDDTDVDDEYRSKGVATMMYAFAKSLGNDIKPSPYQSNAGKNMWSKWGSDAKHLGEQGVAEGKQIWDGTDWGPQGNFAGDTPVNLGGETVNKLQVGDIVTYFGQKARIDAMSKTGNTSRITIANKMGGITQDVLTRDLKRTGVTEENGGVGGGFGTNYPGTYEQENGPFTHKGGLKLTSLTTESVDYLDEK